MNERIGKLAVKAGIKFSAHWAHEGVDTAVIIRRDLKEFAELIVSECVKVAMRSVGDDEPKEAWYLIQEHFGVEE